VAQGAQRLTGVGCSESDLVGVLVDESLPPHEASVAAAISETASVRMSLWKDMASTLSDFGKLYVLFEKAKRNANASVGSQCDSGVIVGSGSKGQGGRRRGGAKGRQVARPICAGSRAKPPYASAVASRR
jgi:hypothetical protein